MIRWFGEVYFNFLVDLAFGVDVLCVVKDFLVFLGGKVFVWWDVVRN